MNEIKWINEWTNENEWMNGWMNEWINKWVNEWIKNSILHEKTKTKTTKKQLHETFIKLFRMADIIAESAVEISFVLLIIQVNHKCLTSMMFETKDFTTAWVQLWYLPLQWSICHVFHSLDRDVRLFTVMNHD